MKLTSTWPPARELDGLVAFLHAVEIELDDAAGGLGPQGVHQAANLERFALGRHGRGGLGGVDRHVGHLILSQAKDERRDLAARGGLGLLDPVKPFGALFGDPGRSAPGP